MRRTGFADAETPANPYANNVQNIIDDTSTVQPATFSTAQVAAFNANQQIITDPAAIDWRPT